MIDREAVRSNAKYLRQVRPIDPDEISDYVPEQPHPAVVRQVLREEAYPLALVETDDGTFVPVDDDPIPHRAWSPRAFPERYASALEDLLVERYGPDWHRGESGAALRAAIRELKVDYFAGESVSYDDRVAAAYAVYHLPDYYAAMGYVLDTLAERGLLSRRLRVLDVGAGTGGPALGLHDYCFGVGNATDPLSAIIDYHAVEPSAAGDILEHMLAETTRNFRTTIHETAIESFEPPNGLLESTTDEQTENEKAEGVTTEDEKPENAPASFDLICFGNVLNELADPVATVERALDWLADDGTLCALEPADREAATELREIERTVVDRGADAVTVYAPTLRLWEHAEPDGRCWSFDVRPDLSVPRFQRQLDDAQRDSNDTDPGAFVNVDLQFAYSLLRTDGERRFPFRASRTRHASMATMDDHVTRRINLLAVKLSHNLSDGGNPLFLVGDGSQRVDHYAVLTRESGLNRDLLDAPYGAVIEFENVLVLWNDDEAAYNLVVDAETVVESLSGH